MPGVLPPTREWLLRRIDQLSIDVATLKNQKTQFIIDASGNCQAIIGWLQYDNKGNATGLGNVWGIASHKTGTWTQL